MDEREMTILLSIHALVNLSVCLESQTGEIKKMGPNNQSSQTADLLPVGCCFKPTEEQLVSHYLFNHISGLPLQNHPFCPVPVFFGDLYGSEEPWELWHRFQSQNSSGLSTGDDVYLITKLKQKVSGKQLKQKKKMAGISNKQYYDRLVGTSGGNWDRSDKDYKLEVDRDEFVGIRKKFSYKNRESKQHGLWLLSEYSISYDGGKTCSEDVICILKDYRKSDESATTKKRKFEQVNTTATELPSSSSKVPKLDDGATSSATLMQMQTEEMVPISFDFSMPSAPNVLDGSSLGDIIHNNELLPTIPSHHSVDNTSGFESGQLDINDIYIDDESIWALLEDDKQEPENSGLLEQLQSPVIKPVHQVPLDLDLPVTCFSSNPSDIFLDDEFIQRISSPSYIPCSLASDFGLEINPFSDFHDPFQF